MRRRAPRRPAWHGELEAVLRQIPGYDPWAQAGDAWLDHAAAVRAINWFPEHLRHVEGSTRGEPFVLRTWQAAIVGNLFGWKRRDDAGRVVRRYRRCFLEVPRGNGKTPLASGIALHGFFEDGEPGAQCFLAAGQREQAGFLFRNARGMVEQDDDLLSRVTIYGGDAHRSIVLRDDPLSFLKVIPADAAGQHGGIPHITVVDELHVQESRDLIDVFETAMSKRVRAQPLMVMITTRDFDRVSICNEVDEAARRVRDNGGDPARPGYDPTFLPVIYDLADADDWRDEEAWPKANPNLDVSVSRESLRRQVQKASETPAYENAVKRLHFNMRTSQDVRVIPMDRWDACGAERLDAESLRGRPCIGGLDLSSTEDLSAFVLLFPLEAERVAVLPWVWCPAAKVESRSRQRIPYDLWQRQGLVEVTDGDQIDYAAIRDRILSLRALYDVRDIGTDPWGGAKIEQELMAAGQAVTRVPQTRGNLSGPTKELIRLVKAGRLLHGGHPVLRWCAGNLAVHYDGRIPEGARVDEYLDKVPIIPSKRKSADKIDPIAAVITALARLLASPIESASVYEDRGMIVL